MHKLIFTLFISFLFSCSSSNDSVVLSTNKVVGDWLLESQITNNQDVSNDCSRQTIFKFQPDGILRQQFYSNQNTECLAGNEIISSWLDLGNSQYEIRNASGTPRIVTLNFLASNTKFSISETNSSNEVTLTTYKKQ